MDLSITLRLHDHEHHPHKDGVFASYDPGIVMQWASMIATAC